MPESAVIPTVGRTQATPTLYNNLVKDAHRMLSVSGGEKTISSGAVTVSPGSGEGYYRIDTESDAAADDLVTISGGSEGDVIALKAENSARMVTLKNGSGNMALPNAADLTLPYDYIITLIYIGTTWYCLGSMSTGGVLLTNGDVAQHEEGDVVCWDPTTAEYVKKCTVAGDRRVMGVAAQTIAAGSQGLYYFSGKHKVKVTGTGSANKALRASATAGRAEQNGSVRLQDGYVGVSLDSWTANDLIDCYLEPDNYMCNAEVGVGTVLQFTGASGTLACGSNSNRYALVAIFQYSSTSIGSHPTATLAGTSMIEVYHLEYPTSGSPRVYITLFKPGAAVPSGNQTVAVANILGTSVQIVAIPFYDVNPTTPLGTQGIGGATSVNVSSTVTCNPGDMIIGFAYAYNSPAVTARGAGQTNINDTTSGSARAVAEKKTATSNSESITLTLASSQLHCEISIPVKPA
jgi:hypothetical protein